VRQATQRNHTTNPNGLPGLIPQDPTARLDTSPNQPNLPHPHPQKGASSTSSINQDPHLMVNVPQSEAPSPQDERLRNDVETTHTPTGAGCL
jgi:hypothetical protein